MTQILHFLTFSQSLQIQNLWVFDRPPTSWGLTRQFPILLWLLLNGRVLHRTEKGFSSPNCRWMDGRSFSWRTFWSHSLFMAVFRQDSWRPRSLDRKAMDWGSFTVGMRQDCLLWTSLFPSEKMTLPQSSAAQSLHLLQKTSLLFYCMFLLERSSLFAALLDTRPSHASLLPFLSNWWWLNPAAETASGDGLCNILK